MVQATTLLPALLSMFAATLPTRPHKERRVPPPLRGDPSFADKHSPEDRGESMAVCGFNALLISPCRPCHPPRQGARHSFSPRALPTYAAHRLFRGCFPRHTSGCAVITATRMGSAFLIRMPRSGLLVKGRCARKDLGMSCAGVDVRGAASQLVRRCVKTAAKRAGPCPLSLRGGRCEAADDEAISTRNKMASPVREI